MLLVPTASIGEIVGCRRVCMAGLAVFAPASLPCASSAGLTALALARFLQGIGAAGIMSVDGGPVRRTYPAGDLGRGIGYNAMVVAVASTAGPSIAAGLLAIASWRWLFAVTVPLAALPLTIALRSLPAPPRSARRFDLGSTLLNAARIAAVFLVGSDAARDSV